MRKPNVNEIANASALGAIAFLLEIIPGPPFDIPFPIYPRITWDFTGIPIMLSQLLYGPLAATYTTLVGCSIIFLRGNIFGAVFKVISELATVFGYAAHRRGAVLSTITASVSRVTVMTVVNYYLLQLFYKMPEAIVVGLLFPIAIFNLTQAIINILPAYLIYQRLRPSEQNKHIKSKAKASPDKKSQSTSPI